MSLIAAVLSVFLTADASEATPVAELPQALCGEVLLYTKLDATCAMQFEPLAPEASIRPKRNPIYEN